MRVVVMVMSLVTCISGHNWYRGPYHFVIDVHRPRPYVSSHSSGSHGTFGSIAASSPDSISFAQSPNSISLAAPSAPFATSPDSISFAQSPNSMSLAAPSVPSASSPDSMSFDTSIQSGFAGDTPSFAESSAVQSSFPGESAIIPSDFSPRALESASLAPQISGGVIGSASPFGEALSSVESAELAPQLSGGVIGSASSFSEASNFLGPAIGQSVPLGAAQSTGFYYGQLPSYSGSKWFDGASKFLHYYKNQHRYGFRPHQAFSHLYYNKKSVAPY